MNGRLRLSHELLLRRCAHGIGQMAQRGGVRPVFVAGAASASFIWFAALGYGARILRPVFSRPAAWRVLDAVVGMTMLALVASLIARVLGPSA